MRDGEGKREYQTVKREDVSQIRHTWVAMIMFLDINSELILACEAVSLAAKCKLPRNNWSLQTCRMAPRSVV